MSDEAAILDVMRAFAETYANHDLEGISALFARDDELVFYGTQENLHFVGWPALRRSIERQFGAVHEAKITYRETKVRVFGGGNAAVVATLLDMRSMIQGAPADFLGIRTTAALEQREGGWRIVHMHWSIPRAEVLVDH